MPGILGKMKKSGFVSKQNRESHGQIVKRLKPFLLLFKLFGLFANKITKGRLKSCSWPFYIICVFWVGVYVLYVSYNVFFFVKIASVTLRMTIYFFKHLIGYISLSVNVITVYVKQDSFIKFFNQLQTYDNEVARLKNARKDNLWILWIATFVTFAINMALVFVMSWVDSTLMLYSMILSDIFTSIMHIFGSLSMFFMLYLLLERFKHLNTKIAPNVLWDKKRRGPNAIKISDVKVLHSILYEAQQAFCSVYSNSFLLWFASFMIHVVANVRSFRDMPLLVAYTYVSPPILQMLILCTLCHYTAEEANKVIFVLSETMSTLVNSDHMMMKINALTYSLHNRMSFEAAGYFTIDLPLFQSVVATVATYFIILLA